MNGALIPNDKLKDLAPGTKLLIHCLDEELWMACILKNDENGLCLYDEECNGVMTYLDDIDFLEAYEFNAEDARNLISLPIEAKKARFVFDENQMVIWDTLKDHVVCLVDTRRPDLLGDKIKELLELANR